MLSKSLVWFSFDGRGYVSSLLFDLRPNYGRGREDNGDFLQKVPCMHCYIQYPQPCSRPPPFHASTRDSWTFTDKSGSVSGRATDTFSWVLVHTRFCLCLPRVWFHSGISSGGSMVGLMATSSKRAYVIPRSAAPRAPAPAEEHCWPVLPQKTLKHSSVSVSVWSLGPGLHKVCLSPLGISGAYGVWYWIWFCPFYHLAGILLCPWTWGISSNLLQHHSYHWL